MAAAVPEVDLVHSHTWYANMAGHLAELLHGIPHVVTAHSLEPHRPWKAEQLGGGYRLSSWAERTAYEAADAVIAVSNGMRTDILESYPDLDPDKVHVVHNGIDTDEFAARLRHRRRRPDLGVDPGPPVRRLRRPDHPAEGPAPPAPGRRAARPGRPARAAGRGARHPGDRPGDRRRLRRPAVRARTASSGSRRCCRGRRSARCSRTPTVFVCPSVYEPLGIVNLEAMACETAVVATAVGGIPEVVVDGETGYLVPYDPDQADDPAAIAAFEGDFADQDQRADRRSRPRPAVRAGRPAAVHRRIQLGQDRGGNRRRLPPRDRGPQQLRNRAEPCAMPTGPLPA